MRVRMRPGRARLTKALAIDGSLNGRMITDGVLSVADDGMRYEIVPDRRVGIGYASEEDQARLWRFKMGKKLAGGSEKWA